MPSDSCRGALLQRPYHLAYPAGRTAGLLGQGPYLVGHHRKAAPLFTGPCRLDGRIEGAVMIRNLPDHLQNAVDLLAVLGQARQHALAGVQLLMKPVDRIPGGGQRLLATGGHLLDLAHQRIGLVGIVSHIADGLAHLGDGRRQLLALGPLLLQVSVYGLDMPPVILRRLQDLLVGVRAATYHGAQLRLLHAQQQFKGGQAVLTPGIEYLAKGAALLLARHGQQPGQPPLQMPAMSHLGQQAEQGDDSPTPAGR